MNTPDLIDLLAADARPVRRLRHPALRTFSWLALPLLLFGLLAVAHGLRADLAQQFGRPDFVLGWAAALATGALAAAACFMLNLPDRSRAWGLLPLPALALWVGGIGHGCLANWVELGADGLQAGETARCFATVLVTSLPLWLALVAMLRRGAVLRPRALAWTAGLAVAAFSAAAVSLFHAIEASAMVLLWNFGLAAVVTATGGGMGRRALAAA